MWINDLSSGPLIGLWECMIKILKIVKLLLMGDNLTIFNIMIMGQPSILIPSQYLNILPQDKDF